MKAVLRPLSLLILQLCPALQALAMFATPEQQMQHTDTQIPHRHTDQTHTHTHTDTSKSHTHDWSYQDTVTEAMMLIDRLPKCSIPITLLNPAATDIAIQNKI